MDEQILIMNKIENLGFDIWFKDKTDLLTTGLGG
jgi:hypothetical protein